MSGIMPMTIPGQNPSALQQAKDLVNDIMFNECYECDAKCCKSAWLMEEERELLAPQIGEDSIINISSVNLKFFDACKFAKNNRCLIYEDRPLDCRLWPLDIVEEEGSYLWCIYTMCTHYSKIRKKLVGLIPKLEAMITHRMFEEYRKQIDVTKYIYLPYKLRLYKKVRPVSPAFRREEVTHS